MKNIIYRDWAYICLGLLLIMASVYVVSTFSHGFFTAVDEGYFLIKLREAYESGTITGKSQWNLIAVHWFPYLDLTSKTNSYLASCILRWFSIIVFTITCCIRFKKERVFRYFAIFLLAYFSYGQDFGLSYIPMQTCVLGWALCAYLLFQYYQNRYIKSFMLVICGFCLCLSGFIVVTGTLALMPFFLLMIIVNAKKDKKTIVANVACLFLGGVLSLVYVHFVVSPLNYIIEAMRFAAGYISKSGHGYDGFSFIVLYLSFFSKLIHLSLYVVGAYYVSSLFKNRILFVSCYSLAILWYFYKTPIMGESTIYIFIISLVFIPLLFRDRLKDSFKNINEEKILYCFLFLFPILAPLGTNCELAIRLQNYVVSWLIIFFSYEYKSEYKRYRLLIIPLIILMLLPVYNNIKVRNDNVSFHFTQGKKSFSEISLTENQMTYFNNIYDIIKKYDYEPQKSVLFTTVYDYSTLYALDAVNSTNFYHTENFLYFDKSKMISPDFVILCPNDLAIIGEELHKMPWGWPEDFDIYDIGTPENYEELKNVLPDYIFESRKLYCRRLNVK